jgi:hypothetical protein
VKGGLGRATEPDDMHYAWRCAAWLMGIGASALVTTSELCAPDGVHSYAGWPECENTPSEYVIWYF